MAKIYKVLDQGSDSKFWRVVGLKSRLVEMYARLGFEPDWNETEETVQVSRSRSSKGWWADGERLYPTAREAFHDVLYGLCQMNDDLKAGDMFYVPMGFQKHWFVFESVWVIRPMEQWEIPSEFKCEKPIRKAAVTAVAA